MRRLVFALVLLLSVLFLLGQMAEIEAILRTSRRGDWRFLLLALAVEGVWLLNVAASYKVIYQAIGLDERLETLAQLAMASNFVNVVAPSLGMGGIAVFIAQARRRGYSSGRVTVAGMLFLLFDYAGFLCVLLLGLIVLLRRHNLNAAEIVASTALLLVSGALLTLMALGMRSAQTLGKVLAALARGVNRLLYPFLKRPYLSEARARHFAHEAAEALHQLRQTPQNLLPPFALALSNKTLLIFILFLVFLAFKAPITLGTLVAGFSVAYLFLIISPTPQGIGVVEGALTLSLSSMYVPLGTAALISLAYRGLTFWLPLGLGLLAFRHLSLPREKEQEA